MGTVYAEITLKNAGDLVRVECGLLDAKDVRTDTLNAIVDTGAGTLIINEEIRQKLGLRVHKLRHVTLADGTRETYGQAEPVNIRWKDRDMICMPLVLPRAKSVLLGAIPLEEMDLIVDPGKQELTGRHGDEIEVMLLKAG